MRQIQEMIRTDLRFAVPAGGRAALADFSRPARLTAEHPWYRAEAVLPPALRAELARDLAG